MFINKIPKSYSEREGIVEQISNWVFSGEQFLNIVTVPNNSSFVLTKAIANFLSLNKKVLYITNEKEESIDLFRNLKRRAIPRNYGYLRNAAIEINKNLIVCNCENALRLRNKYDLVIYDDIRSLPIYNKYEIIDIMAKCSSDNGKLISYSIEGIFNKKREINLPVMESALPLVEPRVITTKIDLNTDIPYTIYEYLKWWLKLEKRVVIYVPDEESVTNVCNYISKYCKGLANNIISYYKSERDEKPLLTFNKYNKGILVTNDLKEKLRGVYRGREVNEMIFFANNSLFDYRKLAYLCGEEAINNMKSKEIIFVANEETEHMDRAKNIIRNFNKEAWEMGLLNI
ncbi:hypothetical protein GCM10008905_26690 [Clostridium malenominatum]|uniref:Uncharacterized protein n=1 Tax=Clostridium malenominatum TaxID=1539 RepID=A0ABP3UCB9_9CLOT